MQDNNEHVPIEFVDCIVHYSGGALPDAPMEFEHSIIEFHVNIVPPQRAMDAMRQIAEADALDRITIKAASAKQS